MVANGWVFRSTFHALVLDGRPTDWLISFAGGTGGTDESPEIRPGLLLRHPIIMTKCLVVALGAERAARRMLAGLAKARAARGTELPRDDATLLQRIRSIPIMANTEDLLGDGDVVRVDGSRGVVEVVSRASHE